ncbi:MAG: hypothetical protein C4523_03615 [Myxococcales bacterium]|nr:MAG: hypothetical protein C4523_03615 [Myxococcales bacterium]
MENVVNRPYPNARLVVYILIGVILGWICVSVAISVGSKVFWEHTRERVVPAAGVVEIDDAQSALAAIRAIQLFHEELLQNVKRLIARYPKQPQETLLFWEEWHAGWRKDLDLFGKRYSFTRPMEMLNAHERLVATTYNRLVEVETNLSRHFAELLPLFDSDQTELRTLLRNAETQLLLEVRQ